jgi:hypothetical protein
MPPPGVVGSAPPPLSIGGPTGYVPTPPPSAAVNAVAPGGAMVIGGALPDKMNTLFIGSIAPGINNVVMEKLLKVRRVKLVIYEHDSEINHSGI